MSTIVEYLIEREPIGPIRREAKVRLKNWELKDVNINATGPFGFVAIGVVGSKRSRNVKNI